MQIMGILMKAVLYLEPAYFNNFFMNIKTLFFGITVDLVQNLELQISVDENCSIANFKLMLIEKYPQLENLNSYAIAVNEEYAEDDLTLKNGDIVAIIPPVSGG